MDHSELLSRFEVLGTLPPDEQAHLLNTAVYRDIPAGQAILCENDRCSHVALVISGSIRAFKVSETGREIALYTVERGEPCVMSMACLLGLAKNYAPLSTVAVQDTRIVLFPVDTFRYVFAISPELQQFVFRNVIEKFYNILDLVETLTFKSVSERLREYIQVSTCGGKKPLYVTHSQLAARLGTSREVVTRRLHELQEEGVVKAARGKIAMVRHG